MRMLFRILLLSGLILRLLVPATAAEKNVPAVYMNVGEPDRRSITASMDSAHDWLIRCSIPESRERLRYTVLQTLSPSLTYEEGSIRAVFLRRNGTVTELFMEEHYLFTGGSVFVEGGTADRICVELTEAGNDLLSEGGELRICYRASFRDTVPMGTQIPGSAQLTCRDEAGKRTIFLSDIATVSTGGFYIHLTNPAGEPIPGGKFMLAREAEEGEKNPQTLDTGNEILAVVYVPFRNSLGEETYTAETDREGNSACLGLSYGNYYLVQTEIPETAGLRSPPVAVTVNEASHLRYADGWRDSAGAVADHTVRITAGSIVMPPTGGPGTLGYTTAGVLVILSACLLLWINRKRGIPV